ncbi:hypothetical protein EI693_18900 [Pseudomonas oryziphila]|uniref:Helix-turn-helix domain-containing protein n=1 Tax=Pseudomonas oryziphila TaxID=2894079 RepID=A0ABN5TN72_9PSED|nr:hypothetical protein EI693_18900 [Pseudomonas oryziphila]
MQSERHRSLSFAARVVLGEMMVQYNGKNNGDLVATRTIAKSWGIGSPSTLQKALRELIDGKWIVMSRVSYFSKTGSRCSLYALSWLPIDECIGKALEINPRSAPLHPLPEIIK